MARSRDHTTMLDADERTQRALELSFAYLNRRERTVSELRLQLERKGITEETADACVTTLLDDGYLDDGRFALMFVHDRRELDGWGSERIRRELASRGVADDLVETALARHEAEWRAGESELDRALALLRRRFPSPPRERRDRDRALGVLIRKGFDSELALDALAAYARS
ncbi:MAG TPA: regulatory protein RecX [Solirubrobacteraceae bacterium]